MVVFLLLLNPGTKTSLFSRTSKVLLGFDETIVDALMLEMKKQKLEVVPNESITAVTKSDSDLTIHTASGNFYIQSIYYYCELRCRYLKVVIIN